MRAQSVSFFATRADLEPGLRAAESRRPVKYVLSGLFPSPCITPISSALLIPELGIAKAGDQMQEDRYLVIDVTTEINVEAVAQRRGGVLYALDHTANPTGIFFRPAGLFEERCLISGEINGFGNVRSLDLYRTFADEVLAGFTKIKTFLVGPEAEQLLDSGFRLTPSVRLPTSLAR